MEIASSEVEIRGGSRQLGDELVPDKTWLRIEHLIASPELDKVAESADGWRVLYRARDGRYWELSYPEAELHGGGAPLLVVVDDQRARALYGV